MQLMCVWKNHTLAKTAKNSEKDIQGIYITLHKEPIANLTSEELRSILHNYINQSMDWRFGQPTKITNFKEMLHLIYGEEPRNAYMSVQNRLWVCLGPQLCGGGVAGQ